MKKFREEVTETRHSEKDEAVSEDCASVRNNMCLARDGELEEDMLTQRSSTEMNCEEAR